MYSIYTECGETMTAGGESRGKCSVSEVVEGSAKTSE